MFCEPIQVVKSRRGSSQPQHQKLSDSLVSAPSASPHIFPLDPGCSIELADSHNSSSRRIQNQLPRHQTHSASSSYSTSTTSVQSHTNHQNKPGSHHDHHHRQRSRPRNELCLVPATHAAALGIDSGVTSGASNSTSPSPTVYSGSAKEALILPESGFGGSIGRRLNGFYDEFLEGLPFRRQPASTYCEPPTRRFSLMGRAGTARNSEFKRNPVAQHRQR